MQKKRVLKKSKLRLIVFGIPSLIFIILFCVTFSSYIYNFSSLRKDENNLNNELNSLQKEKKQLKQNIQKLNDPNYIVRYAKEKYLYSTDGEYVIKLNNEELKKEEEKNENYTVYIVLGITAITLCILFLKKKSKK